jgi:hypothetical protein
LLDINNKNKKEDDEAGGEDKMYIENDNDKDSVGEEGDKIS